MNINDLAENIANIFNQFADEIKVDPARKNNPLTGRDTECKGKNSENFRSRENQIEVDFPNRE